MADYFRDTAKPLFEISNTNQEDLMKIKNETVLLVKSGDMETQLN